MLQGMGGGWSDDGRAVLGQKLAKLGRVVLETANCPTENLKRLFEPGGQMAIEMPVVRHDNMPV